MQFVNCIRSQSLTEVQIVFRWVAGHETERNDCRELRKAIIEGQFAPGDRLVEGELCSRYRVSRTPIREALNQLETEGLVTITPGAGAKSHGFPGKTSSIFTTC